MTRRRLAGEICCARKAALPRAPEHRGGKRWCDKCAPRRKVYCHFMLAKCGWHCQFLESELQTPLPRKLTFADTDKIVELAQRGGALKDLVAKQALEYAIQTGRGSVYLHLTPAHYASLRTPSRRRPSG